MLSAVRHDRAFIVEIVLGVVRWKRLLEWVAGKYASRMPEARLKAFLLVGLYQLMKMDNVAAYAAVNETVAAAKKQFSSKQADFVNAMLRRVIAGKTGLMTALKKESSGIRHSHPDLLIKRWSLNYGTSNARRLCEWNNTRPNVIFKLNELKSGNEYDALTSALTGLEGVMPVKEFSQFYTVPHGLRVEDLPGYAQGLFVVLDPFAVNAVELLNPQPGENILDACAAPGGKTFLIAERMRCSGRLQALDADERRLRIMDSNLKRLGIAGFVRTGQQDILSLTPERGQLFDRIMADAPCSNTGVIRRKPDVRWRFSLARLLHITGVQQKLLDRLSRLLKSGGTLVYSTCSMEPEENRLLVSSWLKKHPSFRLAEERSFFPPATGTDGGYAAAILKR